MRIFDEHLTADFFFAGKNTVKAGFRTMNEATFEEIYEKTARPLWSYVSRIAGNSSLADDIVQETFMRFLRSPLNDDAEEKAVKSYLYKIATNLLYDQFRRRKLETKRQEQSFAETSNRDGFEMKLEESEMMRVFHKMKFQERALLWLAYVEECDHREIAEVLKLNRMSVRVLLFRARRRLANLIESEKGETVL